MAEPMLTLKDELADVIFSCGEREMLRLCKDGRITIRGEQVATNKEAYLAFIEWLEASKPSALD